MNPRIEHFLNKHGASADDILYIDRAEQKTVLHLLSGEVIATYIPVKELLSALPPDRFVLIDKGVVVARSKVTDIRSFSYYLTDGTVLQGRKSRLAPHKELLRTIRQDAVSPKAPDAETILEKFSILDKLPLPFAVIGARDEGSRSELAILYANEEAARIAGKSLREMRGTVLFDLFPLIDPAAFKLIGDVIATGKPSSFTGYTRKKRYSYSLRVFRPLEGCCAALLYFD